VPDMGGGLLFPKAGRRGIAVALFFFVALLLATALAVAEPVPTLLLPSRRCDTPLNTASRLLVA